MIVNYNYNDKITKSLLLMNQTDHAIVNNRFDTRQFLSLFIQHESASQIFNMRTEGFFANIKYSIGKVGSSISSGDTPAYPKILMLSYS